MEISGAVIAAIICGIVCIGLIIYAIIRGQRRKLSTGIEDMIGKTAIAQTALNPKGTVFVEGEGEVWSAILEGNSDTVEPEEEVTITRVAGLKLWVTKKEKEVK
jgi:membrane-bound serine protease (ClpP class)